MAVIFTRRSTRLGQMVFGLCMLVICMMPYHQIDAKVSVLLENRNVYVQTPFRLIIESDEAGASQAEFVNSLPDFNILYRDYRAEFNSSANKISRRWELVLKAKKPGHFVIAPMRFGSSKSPEVHIDVKPGAGPVAKVPGDGILVKIDLQPKSAYQQQELLLRLRLYVAQDKRARISVVGNPVLEKGDAIIKNLHTRNDYSEMLDGHAYSVQERSFAVYPQKSGPLTFKPIEMLLQVYENKPALDQYTDPDFPSIFSRDANRWRYGTSTRVRKESEAVSLDIKSIPKDVPLDAWLPAKAVQVQERWSGNLNNLSVGEPITRVIEIEAEGQVPEFLPGVLMPDIKNMKSYTDKAVFDQSQTQTGFSSKRVDKYVLVPTQAGVIELAPIAYKWWDTKTNKMRVATIPGKTLTILPGKGANQTPTLNKNPVANAIDQQKKSPLPVLDAAKTPPANTGLAAADTWKWVSGFIFLGWLLTVVVWIVSGRSKSTSGIISNDHSKSKRESEKAILSEIQNACANNNAAVCRRTLLAWAKLRWPELRLATLDGIAILGNDAGVSKLLISLDKYLYAPSTTNPQSWSDGKNLWQAFNRYLQRTTQQPRASSVESLPALNPAMR